MKHTEIINYLIQKNTYKSYLEIGIYDGINFNNIKCEHKECCDTCECIKTPACNVDYVMTSDEMFEILPENKKFDIIFIDGMHDESYVCRDIMNSLKHLNKNGMICCHDSLPISEECAKKYSTYSDKRGTWCGDVFKAISKLHKTNLDFNTVNTDLGVTIIKYNVINDDLTKMPYEYEYNDLFVDGKPNDICKKILHIISVNEFKNMNT